MFVFSNNSIKVIETVDERLQDIAYRAISISVIDFGIPSTGGLRTAEMQNELFLDGKSKCDGYRVKSFHQTGKAIDFFAVVDGKASWEERYLTLVATAFMQAAMELGHRVEWGGLWKNYKDMPHIQLVD